MKLVCKDEHIFLSFNTCGQLSQAKSEILISQDIPVAILSEEEMSLLKEPLIPHPDVSIKLSSLSSIKNVIEKVKSSANRIQLSANSAGMLDISVQDEFMEVSFSLCNLINPSTSTKYFSLKDYERSSSVASTAAPTEFKNVSLDMKGFSKFLACHQLNSSNIILCNRLC